jgi:hypothetical protein
MASRALKLNNLKKENSAVIIFIIILFLFTCGFSILSGWFLNDYLQTRKAYSEYRHSPGCGFSSEISNTLSPCHSDDMKVAAKYFTPSTRSTYFYLALQSSDGIAQEIQIRRYDFWNTMAIGTQVSTEIWRNKIILVSVGDEHARTEDNPEYLNSMQTLTMELVVVLALLALFLGYFIIKFFLGMRVSEHPEPDWANSLNKPTRFKSWHVMETPSRLVMTGRRSAAIPSVLGFILVISSGGWLINMIMQQVMHMRDVNSSYWAFTVGCIGMIIFFCYLLGNLAWDGVRTFLFGSVLIFDKEQSVFLKNGKTIGRIKDVTLTIHKLDASGARSVSRIFFRLFIVIKDEKGICIDTSEEIDDVKQQRAFAKHLAYFIGCKLTKE